MEAGPYANRTLEKPFVNPQSTGDEAIDSFISQRIAVAGKGSEKDEDEDEDEEDKEG